MRLVTPLCLAACLSSLALLVACGGSTDSDGGGNAAGAGPAGAGTGGGGATGGGSGGATSGSGGATSGGAGTGGGGPSSAICDKICPKDAALTQDLGCAPSPCETQCPAQMSQLPAKCAGAYEALIDCALEEPSSSFACVSSGGTKLKDGFCAQESEAMKSCVLAP